MYSLASLSFLVKWLALAAAGGLIGYLFYLLWKSDRWKSRYNPFMVIRVALTAALLAVIGYNLYQKFDLGSFLMGLLWLVLGIAVWSVLIAVVERLEQSFELKKGRPKGNNSPPT